MSTVGGDDITTSLYLDGDKYTISTWNTCYSNLAQKKFYLHFII